MKDTKAVYTTYELEGNLNRELFSNRKLTIDSSEESNEKTKNFGCQYDKNSICTCKRIKRKEIRYYSSSRQVYRSQRYSSARGFTDIGVGNVKALAKKRVKRIYLPETIDTGAGSSDLSQFFGKTKNWGGSYYDQKKTSSKCIGGVMDCTNNSVVNQKLSPIIQTTSGSTSPKVTSKENINKTSILSNNKPNTKTEDVQTQPPPNNVVNKTQNDVIATLTEEAPKNKVNCIKNNDKLTASVNKTKPITDKAISDEKDFSSDSLLQHVHNLENPSDYKQSRISIDFIENKLEREYRKIFSTKPKERKSTDNKIVSDFKSASTLRRRFEALRRGMGKKEEAKTDLVTPKVSSRVSVPSKKDVSIVSDPPSLEARSYSNTKIFTPLSSIISNTKKHKVIPQAKTSTRKSLTGKQVLTTNWSTDIIDSDCQGVKGMFKLWGKKFNLDEDNYDKVSPLYPENINKERREREEVAKRTKEKKEGKRFSFFRKRNKDKSKQSYKSRKGVTAGRCEVDGLMIKIGAANEYPPEPPLKKPHRTPEEFNDILRKAWLKRFLSTKVDSKHSAQIRWNNNMYTTSSSTVFELIDCIYKNTDIVFRSKSEMTTEESSYYQSFTNPQINFMHQSIQAWMIPTTTRNNQMVSYSAKKESKNIEVRYSNQKWLIEKSKAFERKIEVVLHSKNFVKRDDDNSSDYIMIDIPEGYFSDTSSNDEESNQTSDEQVYNIVEYEAANSNSYLRKQKKDKMEIGDHASNEIQVTVSVKDSKNNDSNILETIIKRPPLQRDVVLQGSNVYVPKRCDVIGVGIITQRDIRDIKKPILKIQDELTDDSEHILPPQKKCELAESYLQDYYRNWTPLGIDLFSWCVSDSHLRGSSENNSLNSLNQGDGSKSCPNVYDDYQASTIVSSCNTSSCSHCLNLEHEKKAEEQKKQSLFGKFKKKSDSPNVGSDTRRILPKDSLEVFRRRKIYALSNRAVWATMDSTLEPYCVPSIEDKCEQRMSNECTLSVTPICKTGGKPRKRCQKHVSMQNCDVMNDMLKEQLSDKFIEGILSFKGVGGCENCKKSDTLTKRARVIPEPTCEIPQPPCIDSCTKKRRPACSKKNSPSCHKPPPPVCPVGPPSPCQDACPPIAPPCTRGAPCAHITPPCPISPCPLSKPSLTPTCPKSPARRPKSPPCAHFQAPPSPPCSRPKPIPPKIHSPLPVEPSERPCACSPKKSPCNSPECSVEKWSPIKRPQSPIIKYGPCKHSPPKLTPPCTPPPCAPPPCAPPPCAPPPCAPPPCDPPPCDPPPCDPPPCDPPSCTPPPSPPPPSPPPPCTPPPSRKVPYSVKSSPPPPCTPPPSRKVPYSVKSSPPPPCTPPPSRKVPYSVKCSPPPPCTPPPSRKVPYSVKLSPPCSPPPEVVCSPPPPKTVSPCPSPRPKTKCKKSASQEFPWPLKNQMSNSPSKDLGLSCKTPTKTCPETKTSNKITAGLKGLIKKLSGSSIKDCRPDCANRPKVPKCPPVQPPKEPKVCRSRSSKMPGLHLKMLPMPKCPSNACLSWGDDNEGVIRLNSKEKITIRLRKATASTEEIREGCNMKVQDEDGETLYERRDYQKCDNKSHLVKDMYRDSQIQRVVTSDAEMLEKNMSENHISKSIPNIIEINLSLKFKQCDKNKMNLNNCSEKQKDLQEMTDGQHESSKEVYLIQDQPKPLNSKIENKDLDIKIVIKNYKQQSIKSKRTNKHCLNVAADDNFSRKISEKFHTVSTGYSDVFEQQAFSIHTTTIDLTNSKEINKVQNNPDEVKANEQFIENNQTKDIHFEEMAKIPSTTLNFLSSTIIEQVKNEDEVSLLSQTNSTIGAKANSEKTDETNDERSETGLSTTDNDEAVMSDVKHESYDSILPKIHNKEEKKAVLKQIFESADKKGTKNKMQNIRKMLRAVLTSDSSDHEDIAVNNELANELTYASLKPNYFKNSESTTNYYLYDSSMSINKDSHTDLEEMLYPTGDNNSECSYESDKNRDGPCFCSQFAAKLNIKQNKNGCCCRSDKRDKEIICDIIDEACYKCKTELVDVETQDSKYLGKDRENLKNQSVIINEEELAKAVKKSKINKLKTFSPYSSTMKACQMKRINRSTILGLSDDDKVVILDSNNEVSFSRCSKCKRIKPADILQSQETKKAVLEIYAEKTMSNRGERVVARLPKFVYNKESEIRHYQEILTDCSTRNIVMMSITQ